MRNWAVRVKWMVLLLGLFSFSAWAEETKKKEYPCWMRCS